MYAQLGHSLHSLKSRAVFQKRDISATPMAAFFESQKRSSVKGSLDIHESTVLFYLSNHGFHLIEGAHASGASMPQEMAGLAEDHVKLTSALGLRMFYYLLTISAEEAQHGTARNEGLFDFVESATSSDAAKWLRKIMSRKLAGGHCMGGAGDVGKATLGECCKAMEMCFRFAQWTPGFGGLPWAQIAETVGEVVRGTNSLELMVDKAFTLCHNNGAIFNKGHQFTHYAPDFYTILDIQASGQIPAAIKAQVGAPGMSSPKARALHRSFAEFFSQEFNPPYDPSKVKSMQAARDKKAKAAQAKALAFTSSGGGWGGAPAPAAPPKRACDDLLSADDLNLITGGRGLPGFS